MPPICSSSRDFTLSVTCATPFDLALAVVLSLSSCVILVKREDSVGQLSNLCHSSRTDIQRPVNKPSVAVGAVLRAWTTARTLVRVVSSADWATHRLSSFPSSIWTQPSAKMIEAVHKWSGLVNTATIARTPAIAQMMFRLNFFSMSLCFLLGVVDYVACFGYFLGA